MIVMGDQYKCFNVVLKANEILIQVKFIFDFSSKLKYFDCKSMMLKLTL